MEDEDQKVEPALGVDVNAEEAIRNNLRERVQHVRQLADQLSEPELRRFTLNESEYKIGVPVLGHYLMYVSTAQLVAMHIKSPVSRMEVISALADAFSAYRAVNRS